MKTIRFYLDWFSKGRALRRSVRELEKAVNELERDIRLANALAWTAAATGPSLSEEAAAYLASLERVNPETDGDGS